MEPGGPGSFQAVKLQRPAGTTVCSHSTRDMAAMSSIESEWEHNDGSMRVSVRLWTDTVSGCSILARVVYAKGVYR